MIAYYKAQNSDKLVWRQFNLVKLRTDSQNIISK